MKKLKIFQSSISVGAYQDFIDEIFRLVDNKVGSYVCFANVHMLMEAHKNKEFQEVLNNANIAAPDGRPVGVLLQLFEKHKQERVCGMDLFPDLLRTAASNGRSIYLYGGSPEVQKRVLQRATRELPHLRIAGHHSPPYRPLREEETRQDLENIRACSPDLVFVSLGCPRQEMWVANHHDRLNSCLIAVGQAFMTYAGVEKRLPKWMRDLSLEWLYRLYLEPKRLFKRYMVTNTMFLLLTMQHAYSRFTRHLLQTAKLTGNRSTLS
jgi:N-acetylglucosaminyldiphosphoundecaprenol N-acetyl-beta-D-mannosaminyltransferase